MPTKPPRWYFSFRSPYSWLAYRDLLDGYPDVAERIDWIPFWEPDEHSAELLDRAGGRFPYVTMSREKHHYILQDMRRLSAQRGLGFRWPVDRDPIWEVAHLGYLVAAEQGRGREFVAATYRARWENGENISDRAVIARVAESVGLDGAHVASASEDPAVRARGVDMLMSIYRDSVFGVPFFINGHDKYWGVERMGAFAEAVRAATTVTVTIPATTLATTSASAEPGMGLVEAGDGGHAGGCG